MSRHTEGIGDLKDWQIPLNVPQERKKVVATWERDGTRFVMRDDGVCFTWWKGTDSWNRTDANPRSPIPQD